LAGKLGIIISRVLNCSSEFVIDFGDDTFVMNEQLLTRYNPSLKEKVDTEVRKKKQDDKEPMIKEEKPKEEPKTIFISEDDQSYAD
jgi:hypothetical protein